MSRARAERTTVGKVRKRAERSQGGFYIGKLETIMILIMGGVPDQKLRSRHGFTQEDIDKAREVLRREGFSS